MVAIVLRILLAMCIFLTTLLILNSNASGVVHEVLFSPLSSMVSWLMKSVTCQAISECLFIS